jgi:copper(I)-binding protein
MNKVIVNVFCAFVLFGLSFPLLAQDIIVENPWVREAPPNAQALAGYARIKNVGKTKRVLVGVSSPSFERVEFHVTTFEGGMMRMKHLETLSLAPNEAMDFEPGGRHLMLINPKRRLKDGDKVPMTIVTKKGEEISFTMEVRR